MYVKPGVNEPDVVRDPDVLVCCNPDPDIVVSKPNARKVYEGIYVPDVPRVHDIATPDPEEEVIEEDTDTGGIMVVVGALVVVVVGDDVDIVILGVLYTIVFTLDANDI